MKMQGFRRALAALSSLIVGGASFALSFVALRDVSVGVGAVPAHLGFLLPIVVDGGIICGSAVIWSLSKEETRRPVFPFLFVGALVIVSVVVNANHAGPGLLAKSIASLPPLVLLGTLELVAAQGRRSAVATIPSARDEQAATASTAGAVLGTTPPTSPVRTTVPTAPRSAVVADISLRSPLDAPSREVGAASALGGIDGELVEMVEEAFSAPVTRAARQGRANPSRRPLRVRAEEPTE